MSSADDLRVRAVDLIARKRDGLELDADGLAMLIGGYVDGRVSDGQMAAFLMAGVLQGFTEAETRALTKVLVDSGEVLDLASLPGPTVDKHSTGGVGDGTTLLVAPLLAAAGCQLVKLSGRGLGHTGGTLDKLESIPGFRVDLEPKELLRIAGDVGCVVAAQSDRLVPADRALYALRDVTATVASPALIASSVMSKKLASGSEVIVLDVKTGEGAFLQDADDAEQLARLCTSIGVEAGRRCVAIVSAMDQPLGRGIGNALEVAEAIELLVQKPQGRLAEVALELASLALAEARATGGGDGNLTSARRDLERCWLDGDALERLRRMVEAQGGDPAVCDRPREVLPQAPEIREVPATAGGVVARVPARAIGELAAQLGAGRARKGDDVDPAVGVDLRVEEGDDVRPGQVLAFVHARTNDQAEWASARVRELVRFGDAPGHRETVLRRVATG